MDKRSAIQIGLIAVVTLVLFAAAAGVGAAITAGVLRGGDQGQQLSAADRRALAKTVARTTADAIGERTVDAETVEAAVKKGMIAIIEDQTGADGAPRAGDDRERAANTGASTRRTEVPAVDDDDHVQGPSDARYTLIEYSDYECPYCARLHNEVLPALRERYGDDLRVVYRHRPLSMHEPQASRSAAAAECVAALGGDDAFWAFTDALYAQPDNRDLVAVGEQVGVDREALDGCIDDERFADEVAADNRAAQQLNVRGTPTLFVRPTGAREATRLNGAQPAARIAQVLDRLDT